MNRIHPALPLRLSIPKFGSRAPWWPGTQAVRIAVRHKQTDAVGGGGEGSWNGHDEIG